MNQMRMGIAIMALLVLGCRAETDRSLDGLLLAAYMLSSSASNTSDTGSQTVYCESLPAKMVLFIGNSYTFENDLPQLVNDMACSAGVHLEIASSVKGGYRFSDHKSDADTMSAINREKWDYVVLQNQSQVPGWKPAHVETLCPMLRIW